MAEHVATVAVVRDDNGVEHWAAMECCAVTYDQFPELAVIHERTARRCLDDRLRNLGVTYDPAGVTVEVQRFERTETSEEVWE